MDYEHGFQLQNWSSILGGFYADSDVWHGHDNDQFGAIFYIKQDYCISTGFHHYGNRYVHDYGVVHGT